MDDLYTIQSLDQLKHMLDKVFKFVNARSSILQEEKTFTTDTKASMCEYFASYLPKRIGRNLAKIHNLGYVHDNLHPQNISLAGSIYDFDSVKHGTEEKMKDEFSNAESSFIVLITQCAAFSQLFPDKEDEFIEIFLKEFHDSYIHERRSKDPEWNFAK